MNEKSRPKLATVFGKREKQENLERKTSELQELHPQRLVQFNVTIDAELRKAVRLKALQEGTELAPVVRELLQKWIDGEIKL